MSNRQLLPHQQPIVEWARGRKTPGFLLDKRLGKCIVSLRWVCGTPAQNILIVAPKSACPGWLDELEADGLEAWLYDGSEQQLMWTMDILDRRDGRKFFITNPEKIVAYKNRKMPCPYCDGQGEVQAAPDSTDYPDDRMGTCPECLGKGKISVGSNAVKDIAKLPWDAVIWDEISNLRNPKSQINQIAFEAFDRVPYKAGLSGEIAPEGPMGIFEPMRWLSGAFMGRRHFYKWRHDTFNKVGHDWCPQAGKLSEIKTCMQARCYTLSRKAAGLGETKTFERRYCELPKKLRKVYDHVEKFFELPEVGEFSGRETKHAVVLRSWMIQLAGGRLKHPEGETVDQLDSDHKLDVLLELLTGEYSKEQVVLIFRHNAELFAAAEALKRHKIVFSCITGATPVEERRTLGTHFNAGRFRVLGLQVKVAKFGIDLSGADTMIRYSLSDSYEDISQSMDRIVHPMKKRPLHYIDLVCKDTIDEDLVQLAGDKSVNARYFMSKLRENFYKRTGKQLPGGDA